MLCFSPFRCWRRPLSRDGGPPGDRWLDRRQSPLAQAADPDAGAVADVVGNVREREADRVKLGLALGVSGQRRAEKQRRGGCPAAPALSGRLTAGRGQRERERQARAN